MKIEIPAEDATPRIVIRGLIGNDALLNELLTDSPEILALHSEFCRPFGQGELTPEARIDLVIACIAE